MQEIEKQALVYAVEALDGQTDLDGFPAVLHSIAVGLACKTPEARATGFLHDVVEDTDRTFEDLRKAGFCSLVGHLTLLTHTKDVPYLEYITRIGESGDPVALEVKLADLRHNLARGRLGGHEKQVSKHSKALEMLEQKVRPDR